MGGRGGSSTQITNGTQGRSRQYVSVGGRRLNNAREIDDYYNRQYLQTSRMLGIVNAQNRILGTQGGISIGGRVFTTDKQVRDYYRREADKAKEMLRNTQ